MCEREPEDRRPGPSSAAAVAAVATEAAPEVALDKKILLSQINVEKFDVHGFNIFNAPFLSRDTVDLLRSRMQAVLEGEYDSGRAPTKAANKNSSNSNKKKKPSVLHMINISKADKAFQNLALHPAVGEAIGKATGWPSVKFAQDQVWIKPPGASALAFHRDSTYFDMVPQEIVTLWITLDDLNTPEAAKLGPLEYCRGSHKWGDAQRGSASQFFDPDYRALLRQAAKREGIVDVAEEPSALEIETVQAGAGGGSLHSGRCWHGSGPNASETQSRRGIGIHYVRGDAKFKPGPLGKLWEPLRMSADDDSLSELHFPTIWARQE